MSAAQPSGSARGRGAAARRPAGPAGSRARPRRPGRCEPRPARAARPTSPPGVHVGGPSPSGSTGQRAVAGSAVAGFVASASGAVGPLLDAAGAGDVGHLEQELRRPARPVAGRRAPPVPGDQQSPLGPGQRDVEQPALLGEPALVQPARVRGERLVELLAVAARSAASAAGRSAASPRSATGSSAGLVSHVPADPPAGEHLVHQVRHRHHLPLQALGGVHGEHLHPVRRDLDLARARGRPRPARRSSR